MRVRFLSMIFVQGMVLASSGCAKEQTIAEGQVAKLQDGVTDVQKDQDKEFTEFAKENPDAPRVGPGGRTAAIGAANGQANARRIDPQDPPAEGEGDVDDPSPRPVLRATGAPAPPVRSGRGLRLSEGGSAPPATPDDPDRPRPSALDPEARKAYDAALALAQSKRCTDALDAFAGFLVRWPDHPYAPNAMYWRGECFIAQGDNAAALREFEGVVSRFSLSTKAPDALLKLGMVHEKLGDRDKAQAAYARIAKEYPRSDAAKKIPSGAPAAPPKAGGPKGPKENP